MKRTQQKTQRQTINKTVVIPNRTGKNPLFETGHCLLVLDLVLVMILILQFLVKRTNKETGQLALLLAKTQQKCKEIEPESKQVIKMIEDLYSELIRKQRQISKELQMRKNNEEKLKLKERPMMSLENCEI